MRAQLQRATYNARSDHLRRVLEKSRQRRIASRWGWRSLVVNAAGLGYVASLAVQILWHLYGSQVSRETFVEAIRPAECLQHGTFLSQCLGATEPLVGLSLVVGLLCIWWNPQWQNKLSNSEGQLIGLHEYYLAQFILLGLRFSAWAVVFHLPISLRLKAMLHACFAVVLSVLAGWSVFGIVKVRLAPPINWHEDPAPLLTSRQFKPPSYHEPQDTQSPQDRPFNVGSLASPITPTYQSWNPPTPPLDSSEAMDWTPSQPLFKPDLKQINYTSVEPNPFHGTLPALNPRGVVKNPNQKNSGRDAIGLPPGFFDKPKASLLPPRQTADPSEAMAQPRFFGYNKESDTGLENIFDTVFSLHDRNSTEEPNPSQRNRRSARTYIDQAKAIESASRETTLHLNLLSGIFIFIILVGLACWVFEAALTSETSQLGYYFVHLITLIPVGHMLIIVTVTGARGQLSQLLLHSVEICALVGLILSREKFSGPFKDLWDKLAIAVVGLLLPQEFLTLTGPSSRSVPAYSDAGHNPARSMPESQSQAVRPSDKQATTRKLKNSAPTFVRADSEESTSTQQTFATTTDASMWETPRVDDYRFQYFNDIQPRAPATVTRSSTRNQSPPKRNVGASSHRARTPSKSAFGLDGLTLNHDADDDDVDRLSSQGNTNTAHQVGRNLNTFSPNPNAAGSRMRRRL